MNDQYQVLLTEYKGLIHDKRIGLFCNQVSFDFQEGKYLFQLLSELSRDVTLFIPEHGLFAEQQDQVPVEDLQLYKFFGETVRFVSLYENSKTKTGDIGHHLNGIDALIIDIQDVGARYYTFITTIGEIFKVLIMEKPDLPVIVVDRINLAGRQVEGIRLNAKFSSLIGLMGLPHRYGLTIGELSRYLKSAYRGSFPLEVIKVSNAEKELRINPSPNIIGRSTCRVFSGQCLLEGTNLSEGRGTARPFEIFGAPFLNIMDPEWVISWNQENREGVLRPILFVPTFHKHAGNICQGFQLHPLEPFHSLLYSLKMIRALKREISGFRWLEGPYEAGSERPAIELLAGDDDLLGFLNDEIDQEIIMTKMRLEEKKWIEQVEPFVLYPEKLFSLM